MQRKYILKEIHSGKYWTGDVFDNPYDSNIEQALRFDGISYVDLFFQKEIEDEEIGDREIEERDSAEGFEIITIYI